MKESNPEDQLIRLASDNLSIYQDAWNWFLSQGPRIAPNLVAGLEDDDLGSAAHWRILLLLREFALPSTLPAILKAFRRARENRNPIVLPGAMEALAVFDTDEAVSALASLLQSGDVDAAKHATALLGNMGGKRALEVLTGLLDHGKPEIRKSAVQALQRLDNAAAIAALERRRRIEKDPDVLAEINHPS